MEVKLNLSNTEHKELISYCNLNDLLVSEVVKKSYTTGFNIERYGLLSTSGVSKQEVIKEVEKIVEVIKEVVKIEYVEIEKPVEVIKEVEKIVEISNNEQVIQLLEKIKELENRPPKEVIKEVPVEVIKEIVVEKVSELQPKLDALQTTVQKLKQDNIDKDRKISEYEKTIQELQKFQEDKKAMFLRGSNLDDNLYK